ncbi:hypothetical protein NMY22_g13404 [Coprinellus aureogranulatus]|nr:hypothetical protein NMY22_g13404 [Coprinellus aureogranulatus]
MVDDCGRLVSGAMPKAWRGIKGKRGQLQKLVDMPVDVLLEVFRHLEVRELHMLASSSRALRALLLNRSMCLTLWKDAFSRLQPAPPPCPEEVTLPLYASFLFSPVCFTCDKKTGLSRIFECLCVCCKACVETEFINRAEGGLERLALSVTPRYAVKRPGRYKAFLEPFRADYMRHKERIAKLGTDQEREAYIAAEMAKIQSRRNNLNKFFIWHFGQRRGKWQDQNDRRAARENAIMGKLRELGYGDTVQRLRGYSKTSFLDGYISVKPLTDRGLKFVLSVISPGTRLTSTSEWVNIKPTLVTRIERIKKAHEEADKLTLIAKRTGTLIEFYGRYLSEHPSTLSFAPPAKQLARLNPFCAAVYDMPESEDAKAAAVFEDFGLYDLTLTAWKTSADAELRKLLPQCWTCRPLCHGSHLRLETSIFECTGCNQGLIRYPEVLRHSCIYEDFPEDRFPRQGTAVGNWQFNHGPWQVKYYASMDDLWPVLDAYGIDDTGNIKSSLDQMDADGVALECQRCSDRELCRTWREALEHEALHNDDDEGFLTDEDWDHKGPEWRKRPANWQPNHSGLFRKYLF